MICRSVATHEFLFISAHEWCTVHAVNLLL
jgi:hypothetical protein